ncbi:CBS domain-containing protein [Catellatospora chokoriensis]|uniref:CBS domain-containing protein n=1 Tax=Catellatospora chokoriensis TaxID=310353 RepID=A0A8J3KEC5_9ACTN|nr:CBS domain-containing protein [Catellatospora chokoriensis]GIF94384.1 hypothetical protein Cch02nite_78280 [Catellatospora chokoriensis]
METTSAARRDIGRAGPAGRAIREVMTTAPLCVDSSTLLGDALAETATASLRHLVVVDGAGRRAGVLDDRCIVAAWAADPAALTHRRMSSLLDRPRRAVRTDDQGRGMHRRDRPAPPPPACRDVSPFAAGLRRRGGPDPIGGGRGGSAAGTAVDRW